MSEGNTAGTTRPQPGNDSDRREIDLVDYLEIIVRRRWFVLCTIFICLGISIVNWVLPRSPESYIAEVDLLIHTPGEDGVTIDRSFVGGLDVGRLVLNERIPHPGLAEDSTSVYELLGASLTVRKAIASLKQKTQVSTLDGGRGGLLTIAVTDLDSVYAAGIANAYVDVLRQFFLRERARTTQEKLDYIEGRLSKVEAELRAAEDSLLTFQLAYKGQPEFENYLELRRELRWRERRVASWENVYNSLLSRQEAVRMEEARRGLPEFRILGYATSTEPMFIWGRKFATRFGLGLSAGLILAILGANLLDLWTRIKGDGRLRRALEK